MTEDPRVWLRTHRNDRTLLGICPMTESIVDAAIRSARDGGFVPTFVATPRQVDADRGYTGWSQSDLVEVVESTCERLGYDGPYFLARDHGGPYQSTRDRGDDAVELSTAMEYAEELFAADLEAGFDILHVDATEDPRIDGPLPLEEIARRTAILIANIENRRKRAGHSEIYYEVGTEEIAGGMTEAEDFAAYLDLLESELDERDVDAFDRVLFAVGQVGTTMRIDMTNRFDPGKAAALVEAAEREDVALKVHFTDWLDDRDLERFPELGIGGANVGPEFAAAVVDALVELEQREREALKAAGELDEASQFVATLEDTAVRDAPWEKYAPESLDADELDDFAEANRRNVAYCVGRYVLSDPEVAAARRRLSENLDRHTSVDPDAVVVERVQETIDRYADAFELA